ncbi:hypothetical protein V8F06_014249 [Rhypophila decipiens]
MARMFPAYETISSLIDPTYTSPEFVHSCSMTLLLLLTPWFLYPRRRHKARKGLNSQEETFLPLETKSANTKIRRRWNWNWNCKWNWREYASIFFRIWLHSAWINFMFAQIFVPVSSRPDDPPAWTTTYSLKLFVLQLGALTIMF